MKRNTAVLGLAGAISALGMSTAMASGAVLDGVGYHRPKPGTVTTIQETSPAARTTSSATTTSTTSASTVAPPAPVVPGPREATSESAPAPAPSPFGVVVELGRFGVGLLGGRVAEDR